MGRGISCVSLTLLFNDNSKSISGLPSSACVHMYVISLLAPLVILARACFQPKIVYVREKTDQSGKEFTARRFSPCSFSIFSATLKNRFDRNCHCHRIRDYITTTASTRMRNVTQHIQILMWFSSVRVLCLLAKEADQEDKQECLLTAGCILSCNILNAPTHAQ